MFVGTLIVAVPSAMPQLVSSSTRVTLRVKECQDSIDTSLRKRVAGFGYTV
jgi:hypothetical protein